MAEILIGALGRSVTPGESSIRISGPAGSLGFWAGRGGLPQDRIDKVIRRHEHAAGRKSAEATLWAIRENIPRRSGRTAGTFDIRHQTLGDIQVWDVGSSDRNAKRLRTGTGIYGPRRRVIRPTAKQFLKYPNRSRGGFRLDDSVRSYRGRPHPGARYVFKRSVKGMHKSDYFERSAREVRPLVIHFHKAAARAAAAELGSM